MFWKKQPPRIAQNAHIHDAAEIVSKVGLIFAKYNDRGQLVKPRSSLPCSWFAARECFMSAYKAEYLELPESLQNSYHQVYVELAFFVEDDLCKDFNNSLNIAAKCRSERHRGLGRYEDETFCKKFIASKSVITQNRKEIWTHLAHEETCPTQHLRLLAETLSHCSQLHHAMWDEWATFANLISFRKESAK